MIHDLFERKPFQLEACNSENQAALEVRIDKGKSVLFFLYINNTSKHFLKLKCFCKAFETFRHLLARMTFVQEVFFLFKLIKLFAEPEARTYFLEKTTLLRGQGTPS